MAHANYYNENQILRQIHVISEVCVYAFVSNRIQEVMHPFSGQCK